MEWGIVEHQGYVYRCSESGQAAANPHNANGNCAEPPALRLVYAPAGRSRCTTAATPTIAGADGRERSDG